MNATQIIAIRHGETDWNVDARLQGHTDIPLNNTGLWQAQQMASALADESFAHIYSSDLSRAFVTAQALADRNGAPLSRDARLRERCFGDYEGQRFVDIEASDPVAAQRWRKREPDFAPPGGESLEVLQARIAQAVYALASQHQGRQIALVAHGGVLDTLYRLATHQCLQAPRTWELANTSINRLLWTPDSGLTLVGWGDTSHLQQVGLDEVSH
ncbi:MAG: histidine phosphatase family protein [Comamonas sp.]